MRCPFLQEARVRSCQASAEEKCSSPAYASCSAARQHADEAAPQDHCPFLRELLAQFCSAAPVAKYIPYSESLLSRCGTNNHRYCELYLSMIDPKACGTDEPDAGPAERAIVGSTRTEPREFVVEDIRVPVHLGYSSNHMWLDTGEDGCCHIGIDGFLAKVLGRVERLSFLPVRGADRPAAVLTAQCADLQVIFPNRMIVTGWNTHLRAHPERVTSHPYTLGWLFEGRAEEDAHLEPAHSISAGLIHGKEALRWMQEELHRMSEFAREQMLSSRAGGELLMTDGGTFTRNLLQYLGREQALHMFNEFFSPFAGWRKQ
jgi:glycine cleavage system H lipoate-binding protein